MELLELSIAALIGLLTLAAHCLAFRWALSWIRRELDLGACRSSSWTPSWSWQELEARQAQAWKAEQDLAKRTRRLQARQTALEHREAELECKAAAIRKQKQAICKPITGKYKHPTGKKQAPHQPGTASEPSSYPTGLSAVQVLVEQMEAAGRRITTNEVAEALGISQKLSAGQFRRLGLVKAGRTRVPGAGQVYFWSRKPPAQVAPTSTAGAPTELPRATKVATGGPAEVENHVSST